VDCLRFLIKEQVLAPDDLKAEFGTEVAPVDLLSHCFPRALTELSLEDREAILLCDMQGMTQSDYRFAPLLPLASIGDEI
jgi:RNA polymerase sigma-70 factor, ECF subfamily